MANLLVNGNKPESVIYNNKDINNIILKDGTIIWEKKVKEELLSCGTGTSFNIKTLFPDIDYTQLTISNFIATGISLSNASITASHPGYPTANVGHGTGSIAKYFKYELTISPLLTTIL